MTTKMQQLREIALLPKELYKKDKFPDNTVVSSRYTLITFLPKNLFEQFRRMVNFFFLSLIVIQVSIDIPVNPIPYIAAFVFVIGVTGIKQGYEDWCRHKADNKVNLATVNVIDKQGRISKIKSKDIRVSQLIKLAEDEPVPCDLLLIACETNPGISQSYCQITTANLDGESNLKMRYCPIGIKSIVEVNAIVPEKLEKYSLQYDGPNSDLYIFNGKITSQDMKRPTPITMENILLRGSRVKNCLSVFAIAIYTGKDTRLSMNSNKAKTSKFSTIEQTMNKIVIMMFISLLVLSAIAVGLSFSYQSNTFDEMWYLPINGDTNFKYGVTIFFSYLVLLCYMIPVSLSVTFELQKLGCSKFFSWDEEMVCPETGARPLCNTSDLNEELGQIQYLFTDKTGTLTDNDLLFRCCSINGIKYEYSETDGMLTTKNEKGESVPMKDFTEIGQFLQALALCHTVRVLPTNDLKATELYYQANSLDEEVLVKTGHILGVQFRGGEENNITINFFGNDRKLKLLATLEFDSDRKCMSVILEDSNGQLYLFCKGAESSIFPKCPESPNLVKITGDHVTDFAIMGYRTLVMSYKELDRDTVNNFISKAEEFRSSPEELLKLYNEIESNLTLLGCTGVEDKLQAGVPETLEMLKEANIKILMLTGDKLETAISIASSCGLIPESSKDNVFIIEKFSDARLLEKQMSDVPSNSNILVMDGESFGVAVDYCKELTRNIILKAESVIFCRMAPIQKAQVVSLIKNCPKKTYKTCAVGDGGNDCAMLREAHLGIGIIGREGLQAARESDFAVGRFRFLQKAILVHGYWYYQRLATLITYFFYRGVVMISQILIYGFDSGFSAQTIFHSTFVMMFTLSFTSIPVLVQGLTEQPLSQEELLGNPGHYKEISRNELMSFRKCLRWILVGIWHILICYIVPKYVWAESSLMDDHGAFSLFISVVLVIITNTKVLVETRYFTWPALISQLFSYATLFGFYLILCHVGSNLRGVLAYSYIPLLQQSEVWFTILLVGILSVIPDLMYYMIKDLSSISLNSESATS